MLISIALLSTLDRRAAIGLGVCLPKIKPSAVLALDDGEEALIAHAASRRRIHYYGPIQAKSLLQVNTLLRTFSENSDEPIHLHVQSSGGDLLSALYTADLISPCGSVRCLHT